MEKILSISIAAYNVENYIGETLESFVCEKQLMDKIEVIVVNDGSTDGTAEIINKYVEVYPDTFIQIDKKNGGYGSTINEALRIAKGKYFRPVDGDDWVLKDALKELIGFLEEVNSDLVMHKFRVVDEKQKTEKTVGGEFMFDGKERNITEIGRHVEIQMHQAVYKTSLLKENGIYITENCFYTDSEYVLKPLAYAKSFSCIDIVVYCYRTAREGQSVLLESRHKYLDQAMTVALGLAEYWENIKCFAQPEIADLIKNVTIGNVKNKYLLALTMHDARTAYSKIMDFDDRLKSVSGDIYDELLKFEKCHHKYGSVFCVFMIRKTGFCSFVICGCLARLYRKLILKK